MLVLITHIVNEFPHIVNSHSPLSIDIQKKNLKTSLFLHAPNEH